MEDSFDEGPYRKVREGGRGEIRVRGVATQHGTITIFLFSILACDLKIVWVLELAPAADVSECDPVICQKASIICFLVVAARKS